MRALLAALCFLAFLASGAVAPANAHPGHGAGPREAAADVVLAGDALPAEARAADHRCPAHGDEADGTCALLHVSCCGLHGGALISSDPAQGGPVPPGGYRGPGPQPALTGATGSPLFEPPRA